MAAYQVEFLKSAEKEFEKLPARIKSKVGEALALLSINPFSELLSVKKLKGAESLFRVRLGDYRVVYEVRRRSLVVVVVKIGHRGEIYRRL